MYVPLSNVLDIYYLAVCIETEPLLGDRGLDWILGVENLVEFLELLLHVSQLMQEEREPNLPYGSSSLG